jgi:hypothetical protein
VRKVVRVLEGSSKPVLLGGPRLRANGRRGAFRKLAEAFKVRLVGCVVFSWSHAAGLLSFVLAYCLPRK